MALVTGKMWTSGRPSRQREHPRRPPYPYPPTTSPPHYYCLIFLLLYVFRFCTSLYFFSTSVCLSVSFLTTTTIPSTSLITILLLFHLCCNYVCHLCLYLSFLVCVYFVSISPSLVSPLFFFLSLHLFIFASLSLLCPSPISLSHTFFSPTPASFSLSFLQIFLLLSILSFQRVDE